MADSLQTNKRFEQFKRYYRSLEPELEKPKNKIYTSVIFSFLAISLFSWFAIKPTIQTIIYLQREISDKTVLDKKMEQKIANLIETQTNYENVKNQLSLIEDAIPLNPDSLDAVIQLKNLINTTEATISSLQVAQVPLFSESNSVNPKNSTPQNEFAINAMVSGKYADIEQYLNGLVGMRRIFSIDTLTLSPDTENTKNTSSASAKMLHLIIQLKSYYK
jgi:Tfp pilus assembly protein PilO